MAAHYLLSTYDERDNNWVTMQDNLYGAPSIYQSYIPWFCRTCRRVNKKAVFESGTGFEAGPQIRVTKGRELAHSGEDFFLIRTRVLRLLKSYRVRGYSTRPIPQTNWHVLRVTTTVPYKQFKPKYDGPPCKSCGYRPYYGLAEGLHQIGVPSATNTFFAPKYERPQDQDVYLTEDLALMLKANRVKGALLTRLLTKDEYELASDDKPSERGKVKGQFIFL